MRKVLVADDSKTTQMIVANILQKIPSVELLQAGNGVQALAILDTNDVHLLVTDINMPEMDGIALVKEVRRRKNKDQLPILIITAKAELQAKGLGLESGADGYILKPISAHDLRARAEMLLDRREAAR
jgi:DNA-binding response OmpR family regulator